VDTLTIIAIAFGLSMDAFAVSMTSGLTIKRLQVNHALRIALSFGIFQAMMPLLGWLAGLGLRDFIAGVDHWVAYGLLSIIGGKMIYGTAAKKSEEKTIDPLNSLVLLGLSVAISIDALVVGLSFAFLKVFVATPIIVIGAVTFILSFIGVFVGNKFGRAVGTKMEIIGGLILIGIGVKILIEHLS
jgi:putative Mn2+ efflux pump MntP